MHSARTTWQDDADPADEEPVVLSYVQFRNRLGLLEWQRRRAEYLQGTARSAPSGQPRPSAPVSGR